MRKCDDCPLATDCPYYKSHSGICRRRRRVRRLWGHGLAFILVPLISLVSVAVAVAATWHG